MKGAKLIGGPKDGQIIPLTVLQPKLYFSVKSSTFVYGSENYVPAEPMKYPRIIYKLYDDWPVKYLYHGYEGA